jgi:hypothetical protein
VGEWKPRNGDNRTVDETRCRESVSPTHGWHSNQCQRKAKVDGKWCTQHDPEHVKAKRVAQSAKWAAESDAIDKAHARLAACLKACAGLADPAEALRVAREALESAQLWVEAEISLSNWSRHPRALASIKSALRAITPTEETE